jgi:hypothetical protein
VTHVKLTVQVVGYQATGISMEPHIQTLMHTHVHTDTLTLTLTHTGSKRRGKTPRVTLQGA